MNRATAIRIRIFLSAILAGVLCAISQAEAPSESTAVARQAESTTKRPWLDAKLNIEERVHLLLQEMTLEEKVGQLWQVSGVSPTGLAPDAFRTARDALSDDIHAGRVGSVLNEVDTPTLNALQKDAVEGSRLRVPLLFGRDVIHGFRTIFPIPLGQAASWNPELVESAAAIAAREARSVGIRWTFAPMVDIARDPRWGRIAESLGEDPYLASAFSAAMVRGFQGTDLTAANRIAACAKHFAGYGAGEGGRDYNSAVISPSSLRNNYLPPFHAAVKENVATLMTAFNDLNGVPGTANTHLLQNVLRKEWKFNGFVVSDWESVRELIVHGYCRDENDAARTAALAGVNMEMVSRAYHDHLATLVKNGDVPESTLDNLVSGVLRVKFRLGLFDQPAAVEASDKLLADDALQVARQLATQSVVLLKNDDQLLPLKKSAIKKLAIIGPLADDKGAQLGAWALDGRADDSQSLLAALRQSAGKETELISARGLNDALDTNTASFDEAVAAARQSDAVVLVVGEGADLSGEAHSRAILDLPGAQNQLVDAIAATGKPIVLVVETGRPLTIGPQIEKVKSVLYSFHAGTMAGPAIADLIWGNESPSAKLPVTFPKSGGQIPLYYNHTNTGRPPRPYDFSRDNRIDETIKRDLGNTSNYMDVSPYPLYPFGYGLSYTTFEYGPVKFSAKKIHFDERLTIHVQLSNTGSVAGDEMAELYIHEIAAHPIRPVRELKGFRRVHLKPGKSANLEFSLSPGDLAYFNNDEQQITEPGDFEVFVGGSSLAPLASKFELAK